VQLIWTEPSKPNNACPYDHTTAETPFGEYLISWKSWKDYPGYGVDFCENYVAFGDTLEEAKNLAQADFDRRLAACR